jgi:hypothetical protein
MSKAARDRRNRKDNKVRGSAVLGGVRVDATRYVTGRTDVSIRSLAPRSPREAALLMDN